MTSKEIHSLLDAVYSQAVGFRRFLHSNPEMGNCEKKTTEYIKDLLTKWNIPFVTPLDTGVVGILSCGEGKTTALRADIDALAVTEQTGLEFASKTPGVMHACGHDIHTAALLAAAKVLSENRNKIHGTVKFIFQPDEEGSGGAKRLIDKGVFLNPKVDRVFGAHIRPEIPAGYVAVKYGKSYAASDIFTVTVTGKSAHGAEPQNGKNALTAASRAILALDSLPARILSPTDSAVVSVCQIESGTACNILPEKAVFTGIIRSLGQSSRRKIKRELVNVVSAAAQINGCTAKVDIKESYPGVVNDNGQTDFVYKKAVELFGEDKVIVLQEPTMTTEDFGYYLNEAPGSFFHVGAQSDYPLHSGMLNPNEEAIRTLSAMFVALVL